MIFQLCISYLLKSPLTHSLTLAVASFFGELPSPIYLLGRTRVLHRFRGETKHAIIVSNPLRNPSSHSSPDAIVIVHIALPVCKDSEVRRRISPCREEGAPCRCKPPQKRSETMHRLPNPGSQAQKKKQNKKAGKTGLRRPTG